MWLGQLRERRISIPPSKADIRNPRYLWKDRLESEVIWYDE